MIKNIIFDIGNVLAHFRGHDLLQDLGLSGEALETVADATIRSGAMWNEFDRSVISDEEVITGCVAKAPQYEKEIHMLFDNIRYIAKEYPYAQEWIKGLKAEGYRVYLLSNYGRTAFEATSKELGFISLTDGMVISYEVKYVKPEPEIYQALFDKYNLKPDECVFLDDREENIRAAESFGMHGIVVQSKEQADEELRNILEEN